jgi:hypothetical protein
MTIGSPLAGVEKHQADDHEDGGQHHDWHQQPGEDVGGELERNSGDN